MCIELKIKTFKVPNMKIVVFAISEEAAEAALLDHTVCIQGPVAQSIVSLTSSLRGQLVKCFTTV